MKKIYIASEENLLEVVLLHKSFDNTPVLKNINLKVKNGEVVCIIGPSGSGKSTLLRCFNWLIRPSSGIVILKDEVIGYNEKRGVLYEITPSKLARQRSRMGMVSQHFDLFPQMTAIENVSIGPVIVKKQSKNLANASALEILEKVGMREFAEYYPGQLSGGQQQRVAIARALVLKPELLLFDEPTSALDPELVGEVLEVMRRLAASGMTMVVVSHEMSFVKRVADRVVFMEDGMIVDEGSVEEVLVNPTNERTIKFLSHVK